MISKYIFCFLCLFCLLQFNNTYAYGEQNPLANTAWKQSESYLLCMVMDFREDTMSLYIGTCNSQLKYEGTQPYDVTPGNNNMFHLNFYGSNGSLSKTWFIGFIENGNAFLRCPSDNWESCRYSKDIWRKGR